MCVYIQCIEDPAASCSPAGRDSTVRNFIVFIFTR